jgi:hypothetical protein
MTSAIRNDLELQLFGLQRSGNHAVAAWLFQQFEAPVIFFNNVSHFSDPVLHWHSGVIPNTAQFPKAAHPSGRAILEEVRLMRKAALAISYENLDLRKLPGRELIPNRLEAIGQSGAIRRVVIFREFYNWFASRLRLVEIKGDNSEVAADKILRQVALWRVYAHEVLGKTRFLSPEPVAHILFDKWAGDAQYRRAILAELQIACLDNAIDHVPPIGGGSSFDGTSFAGRGADMQIGQRWKYLLADQWRVLRPLLKRQASEIDDLNASTFGELALSVAVLDAV